MTKGNTNNAGRPTVLTPKVVSKLEALLGVGLTVREACLESEISHETYYSRLRSDLQFADKMAKAQSNVNSMAKKIVAGKIISGDVKTAKWWLERSDKKELEQKQTNEPVQTSAAEETAEPSSLDELIELYEGYERLIALMYKQSLMYELYQLPEVERHEPHSKLNTMSDRELYELAIEKHGLAQVTSRIH